MTRTTLKDQSGRMPLDREKGELIKVIASGIEERSHQEEGIAEPTVARWTLDEKLGWCYERQTNRGCVCARCGNVGAWEKRAMFAGAWSVLCPTCYQETE